MKVDGLKLDSRNWITENSRSILVALSRYMRNQILAHVWNNDVRRHKINTDVCLQWSSWKGNCFDLDFGGHKEVYGDNTSCEQFLSSCKDNTSCDTFPSKLLTFCTWNWSF